MYENYVFDLYGTLVDIHTDEEIDLLWDKMSMFYGYQGAFYETEELHDAFYDIVNGKEQSMKEEMIRDGKMHGIKAADAHEAFPEIKIEYVFQELFARKGIKKDLDFTILTGQFFRALSTDYVRAYEGVKELFEAIQGKGKKIYLLSNAQRAFTEYELRGLDIFKYFDGIMISSDCGIKKPDVRFFEMLLDRYELRADQCIMIGNDMSTDIAGAKAVGMDTYYIHSNISPELKEEPVATYVQRKMDMHLLMERLELL